ncbi:hypothetical protein ACFYZ2_15190 [Streptomyces sviceus]|uniref:hypothetical protein n=1 Tax=Streptomyces sviceus TaxID=285530 RepID=UPI00367E6C80
MTAMTAAPGRDRCVVPLLAPSQESRVGRQAGITYLAMARRERAATATTASPGRDRCVFLLPGASRQDGVTRPLVARPELTAVRVGAGRGRPAGLLPTPSGPTCVPDPVVAHRAARPAGSGQ